MELKRAITQFLSKSLNDTYQQEYGTTAERPFVFECDFTRDDGNFMLFDESGKLVIDQYLNYVKYIPCSVYSLIADMIEIPNLQVLDALVPIEMFVDNQRLEMAMEILSLFQQKINGVPFQLEADYQGQTQNCNIIMTFNLPSDDDFQIFDGINGKVIDFQISANITFGVVFGNSIQYELSIDNGETFEPIIKTNPNEVFVLSPYTDQIINDDRTRDLSKVASWSLSVNAIVKANSILEDLVLFSTIPYKYLEFGNLLEKAYLKTYFYFKKEIHSPIDIISGGGNVKLITTGCEIDLLDLLENVQDFAEDNPSATKYITIYSSVNKFDLRLNAGEITIKLYEDYPNNNIEYVLYDNTNEWRATNLTVGDFNYKTTEETKTIVFGFQPVSITFGTDFSTKIGEIKYPNYFIKPVLITQIVPQFDNADIASVVLEFKDKFEI